MASKFLHVPAVRLAAIRSLSAQVAAQPSSAAAASQGPLPRESLKSTTLENGLTIHSVENQSPISRIVIVTKAGARYEDGSNLGMSHLLRNAAGLTTQNSSTFAITKNIEWFGGNLYASATRDHIIYTLECNRDHAASAIRFLNDTVFAPEFRPWELEDAMPRLRRDIAAFRGNQSAQLMDALHKAAFRGGLSNSLFAEEFNIERLSKQAVVEQFVKQNVTGPRTVVSAVGVDHERICHLYKQLTKLPSSSGDSSAPSRFNTAGGETRVEFGSPNTMVALAMESAGLANAKETLTMEVIKHVLGMSKARVPYSTLQATRLGKAVHAAKPTKPFSIGAFTAKYSDTGLFGIALAAHPSEVASVAKAAVTCVRELGKGSVQDAEVQAAVQKAKYAMAKRVSKDTKTALNTGIQHLTMGSPQFWEETEKIFDSITKADVSAVAAKMTKVKPCMAAVGRLSNTPHVDELMA